MMWLMSRPVAPRNTETSHAKPDSTRFTESELALLSELLQTSSNGQPKRTELISASMIEERAA